MTKTLRNKFRPANMMGMLLQFEKFTIRSEADSFKEYITDNRFSIKKQQDEFDKMIKKQADDNPDNAQDIYEWNLDQHYQYNEFYPALFNNSTFLSIYSSFEFNLKHLCDIVHQFRNYKIKPDDLSGRGYIEKSKRYLQLVAEMDLTNLESSWQEIIEYNNVRNCIVHNNSSIIKSKDQAIKNQSLYKVVKNNNNLKLNEDKGTFIISNDKYLINFCDTIETYLMGIVIKLENQEEAVTRKGSNRKGRSKL